MKLLPVISMLFLLAACKTKPFVTHDLSFKKVAENCDGMNDRIGINSNLNGERYELQRCLDADFTKEQLTSTRHGDTVVLQFGRKNTNQALYDITIDVDAYPRYNILILDGATIPIRPVEN